MDEEFKQKASEQVVKIDEEINQLTKDIGKLKYKLDKLREEKAGIRAILGFKPGPQKGFKRKKESSAEQQKEENKDESDLDI